MHSVEVFELVIATSVLLCWTAYLAGEALARRGLVSACRLHGPHADPRDPERAAPMAEYPGREAERAPGLHAHFDVVFAAIAAGRAERVRLHRAAEIDDATLHERDLDALSAIRFGGIAEAAKRPISKGSSVMRRNGSRSSEVRPPPIRARARG